MNDCMVEEETRKAAKFLLSLRGSEATVAISCRLVPAPVIISCHCEPVTDVTGVAIRTPFVASS